MHRNESVSSFSFDEVIDFFVYVQEPDALGLFGTQLK